MKTINRKNVALGAGLLSIGAAFATVSPAFAAPRDNDVREERREAREARKEVRDERRDVKRATTPVQRREERREYKEAKRDYKSERRDVREERREAGRPPYGNAYGYHRNRNTRPTHNRPVYKRPAYKRPTYTRPNASRPVYRDPYNSRNNPTPNYRNGQRIEFPGVVLNNVSGSPVFNVRGDNGITYRVRTRGSVNLTRGQRVRVSGDWHNNMVINSGINFL